MIQGQKKVIQGRKKEVRLKKSDPRSKKEIQGQKKVIQGRKKEVRLKKVIQGQKKDLPDILLQDQMRCPNGAKQDIVAHSAILCKMFHSCDEIEGC